MNLRRDDISQFVQVFVRKIPVISIAPLNVLLDAVQVKPELFQQFALKHFKN